MLQTPSQTPDTTPKITRGHSCILCQQRKVKCDRQKPCSNCIKARAECIPSAPLQPRRRKRKLTEIDLAARLRKYEHLLRTHGVKIDHDDDSPPDAGERSHGSSHSHETGSNGLSYNVPRTRNVERGALFADKENSHYVENTLWENLRDEIQDPKDALQEGSSEDDFPEQGGYPTPEGFLFGSLGAVSRDLGDLHPPPVHIFRLWQTFLVNVNPMVKMFHAPTIQQMILDASGDLANVPRHTEALMFAIYFISIISLQDQDCRSMFNESKEVLLAKYSTGAQQSLVNSRFLKSLNILTLQAFILYLLGVRQTYDPHSLWILSGVAVRISQRLGLHRDGGHHQISPFDAEIRRRTWWQVVFLDGHSSKLAGAGFPAWLAKFDTKVPLNISDSDLSPGMTDPPQSKEGATEMIFCCLRYETAQALRGAKPGTPCKEATALSSATGPELIPEKDRAIDELEARFQEQFLKYCDPSIPLHLLTIYVAKSVICTMRIMAHHPRQYPDKGASMPQKEKDMLFTESLKELEFDSLGHTNKCVQGYLWHVASHFQLDAFIYLLSELRHRTSGELVDRAWRQIELSFQNRPEMINDTKNSLYVAIGNLALKAWQKREEAQGNYQVPPPRFISLLRAQRNISEAPKRLALPAPPPSASHYMGSNGVANYANNVPQGLTYNNMAPGARQMQWAGPDALGFDPNMPEITPVDWEYWQTLMDGDLPAYAGEGQNFFS
ncbi:hypothetical protein IFR04_007373 [Cadophora malorum]|uniref:Zn(2)-C6 fungal-type domain-containing protein n=1 Tax=Cadophora malorum TaxID=108018 RepID=A0A8H7TGX7_9HELO|nr:hypothetical protein IFR04_007373 [Cadophora malorum]